MNFKRIWRVRRDIRQILYNQGRPAEDLRALARRLGRLLNKKYKTGFHWNPSTVLERNHLVFSGTFDYYERSQPISIWINTHPDSWFYTFGCDGKISWRRFVNDLSECIMHEVVHQHQWRQHRNRGRFNINSTGDEKIDYYSDPDEIDAYAWSLASEWLDRKVTGQLNKVIANAGRQRYSVWYNYYNLFPKNHPVRKRLLKKTYTRIQFALQNDVD